MDAGRHAERQNPPCSRHSLYIVAQHACRGRSQLDNSATRVCTPPGATRLQQPGGPLNEALHPVPQQVQSRRTLQAAGAGPPNGKGLDLETRSATCRLAAG